MTGATGSGDIPLTGTRTVSGALAAGASSASVATVVTVPATTNPGDYYVCALADAANAEKFEVLNDGFTPAEDNNGLCTATPISITL